MSQILIIAGIILIILGLLSSSGFTPFGKLPGDITIKRDNFTFHFPLATSIIISIIITVILWILSGR